MKEMNEIFLSASIPVVGRGDFHASADPFLIQFAVREFVTAALGRRLIVFGGHPAITPMIWAVCEHLGVSFSECVVLYQSKYFSDMFPEENLRFKNVVYIDGVPGNRDASLAQMRQAMLSREGLATAVFIGGMEGVLDEYAMFTQFHPKAKVIALASPGGAARQLAERLSTPHNFDVNNMNYSRIFHEELSIKPTDIRAL